MEARINKLYLIIILGLCSCDGSELNLNKALIKMENHSTIMRTDFNDSTLIRKSVKINYYDLNVKGKPKGIVVRKSQYNNPSTRRMKHFPKPVNSDEIFHYGEVLFSNTCITCHDPQNINLSKWLYIEKEDKPLVISANGVNYLLIEDEKFHSILSFLKKYEKEALKEYIHRVK